MDSLDESPEDMASCASARASGLLLAKLSKVGYCRDGCRLLLYQQKRKGTTLGPEEVLVPSML